MANKHGIGEQAERVAQLVSNCLASDPVKRAVKSGNYLREVPFCYLHEGAFHEGVIDLLFVEQGSPVVVDYKTDRIKPEDVQARVKHYAYQLDFYVGAVKAALGKRPGEVILVFANLGKWENVPVS